MVRKYELDQTANDLLDPKKVHAQGRDLQQGQYLAEHYLQENDPTAIDREWLERIGIWGRTRLSGDFWLECYGTMVDLVFDNTSPGEYYTHRAELTCDHIKTRGQLRRLVESIVPDYVDWNKQDSASNGQQ